MITQLGRIVGVAGAGVTVSLTQDDAGASEAQIQALVRITAARSVVFTRIVDRRRPVTPQTQARSGV